MIMPFVFEGILEGGTDPGAEVDVALGAQSGEGVVEFWRDTDQQGFIFHLISEYITAFTGDHRPRWALRMPAAFTFLKKRPHFFKSYQSWQ